MNNTTTEFPSIQPVTSIETMPFKGYDGTNVGSATVYKKTNGKSMTSAFNNAENFLYRMQETVLNDFDKGKNGESTQKPYDEMFQDFNKEHSKEEIIKNFGGKKNKKKKTRSSKRRYKKRTHRKKSSS